MQPYGAVQRSTFTAELGNANRTHLVTNADRNFHRLLFKSNANLPTPRLRQTCTMKTNLPDLPFTNYAKAELNPFGTHSSAKSGARNLYPKTDLKTFTHWASFPEDIHRAVQSATTRANLPSTPFIVEAPTKTTIVENEEKLRAHAVFALHNLVEEVLDKLGVKGMFTMPGGGNAAIVGDPDFSWVANRQSHPKVIVRV
jgi:hypothetical protein